MAIGERRIRLPEFLNQLPVQIQIFELHRIIAENFQGNGTIQQFSVGEYAHA